MPENPTLEIDLAESPPTRLSRLLIDRWAALSGTPVESTDRSQISARLMRASGQHFLGAGLANFHSIAIEGSVGDYALCGMENCECTLEGDAGSACGHSMVSGVLVVSGSVGDDLGALSCGGLIAVYGSAGARAGISLRGADVIVRGSVGENAGYGMRDGNLVVGGNAGPGLGRGIRGGTLYLRGRAEAMSEDVEEHRLRESDRLKLGLLLLKAGIKASVSKEFRVYRKRSEGNEA